MCSTNCGIEGQEQGEDGAGVSFAMAAANAERTIVPRYDLLADPQSETCAIDSFSCEEGIEDVFEGGRAHSNACIGDGKGDAISVCGPMSCFTASKQESTAGGHCIDSVGDEIVEHLANVSLETRDGLHCMLALFDGDLGVPEFALVDAEDREEEVGAADCLGVGRLFVKTQGLVRDDRDAAYLLICKFQKPLSVGVDGVLLREIDEIHDRLEGVVDLVSDGGGESAHSGEFFALYERGFGSFQVGHITAFGDQKHDLAALVEDWCEGEVERDGIAGGSIEGDLLAKKLSGCGLGDSLLYHLGCSWSVDEPGSVPEVFTDHVGQGVAGEFQGGSVAIEDDSLGGDDADVFKACAVDRTEAGFALSEGFLYIFSLGDVECDAGETRVGTVWSGGAPANRYDPADGAVGLENAVLAGELLAAAQCFRYILLDSLDVLRVDVSSEFGDVDSSYGLGGGDSVETGETRIGIDEVVGDVPVPGAYAVGRRERQTEPLFALLQ